MRNILCTWIALITLLFLHIEILSQDKSISPKSESSKQDVNSLSSPTLSEAERLLTLAGNLYQQGKYDEAAKAAKQSLEIREKLLPNDNPAIIMGLRYLAMLYRASGEYGNARELYLRVLKIQEAQLGATNFEVAKTLKQIACMSRRSNRQDEAKELDIRASKIIYKDIKAPAGSSGGVLQGKVLSKAEPIYPEEAKRRHITGEVVVEVIFDEAGKVVYACAVKGHPILSLAAEEAAMRSLFAPVSLAGQPIKVTGAMTYKFKN